GVGGVTWSADSGALPGGVVVDASGTISGVPQSVGTFAFVVRATDAASVTTTATLSLTIERRDIVLYAADATVISGAWSVVADATAAGGRRLANPDAAAAKLTTALASPVNYFELTFNVEAGVAYHLWMRGKAEKNNWANDSVYVQFSESVDVNHAA